MKKVALISVILGSLCAIAVIGCIGKTEPEQLVVFAAASDVAIGTTRVPLKIQLIDGSRFDDRAEELKVTYTSPTTNETYVVDDLTWRAWPVRSGTYTSTMTFDEVGLWSIKVRVKADKDSVPTGSGILVKSATDAPNIGDPAPLTPTKIRPDDGNLRSITSAPDPDPDLYSISFDDAVATGKPTVITFSTPAYCQSATCGPQTEVLSILDDVYEGQASFIHVEIFDNPKEMLAAGDPSLGIEAPVIHEWEFHTEPWTFVVDGNGIVVGRFEAFATQTEIEEYLVPLLR
ncbi:MAG: hypothetical protein OSB68_10005 [Dehalococcoidia bacterium]|nr:hypothetical protein [Dehalococcoidia bacterium]